MFYGEGYEFSTFVGSVKWRRNLVSVIQKIAKEQLSAG